MAKNTLPNAKLFTCTEAAKLCGISRQRVGQLIKSGLIEPATRWPMLLLDAAALRKLKRPRPNGRRKSFPKRADRG